MELESGRYTLESIKKKEKNDKKYNLESGQHRNVEVLKDLVDNAGPDSTASKYI